MFKVRHFLLELTNCGGGGGREVKHGGREVKHYCRVGILFKVGTFF